MKEGCRTALETGKNDGISLKQRGVEHRIMHEWGPQSQMHGIRLSFG